MEFELIKRKVGELKPDPDQPRKEFDNEKIENLAKTIESQGIINPIEIDENNVIITGEMRWRASKLAFKNGEEIECKLLRNLSKNQRFLRQAVENFNHSDLTGEEEINAVLRIKELFPLMTQQDIASQIGRSQNFVKDCLRMPVLEKKFGKNNLDLIGKKKAIIIDGAIKNPIEQKALVQKVEKENISTNDLIVLVRELKEMPKDVYKEVIKPNSNISRKDAQFIMEFKDPQQRKQITTQIKDSKQTTKKIFEEEYAIMKGEKKPPVVKILDVDREKLEKMNEVFFQITQEYTDLDLQEYSPITQEKCIEIMRKAYQFIYQEVEKYGKRYLE